MWFAVGLVAAAYYPRFVKLPAGMETYPQAAACLWHGQVLQVCDPGFTYPPFFALVMLPFVPMPLWLRDLVWYGVTLAAAFGAFKLSETIAGKSLAAPLVRAELFWLRLFALLLSAKLILAVFENQAYDALVLVAVLIGLFALSADRPLAAGAGLALAAALKATPLIFLPYLLLKRYFVAAAAFVLVYALASLLPDLLFAPAGGPGYFSTWLGEVAGPALGINRAGAPFAFWDGANILNHSLRGAVALNVDEAHHRGLFEAALAFADGCFVVLVGTLLAVSPRRPQAIAIDGSLLLIAMLMLSPMTSRSHYVAHRPVLGASNLVPVMIGLVGPVHRNIDVIRLLVGQLGQLHPNLVEMQPRDFFVELFGQRVNLVLVLVGIGPQLDLRQRLVGER